MSVTVTAKTLTETVIGLQIINGATSILEVAFVDAQGVERLPRKRLSLVNGQLIDEKNNVIDSTPPTAYLNAYSPTMPSAITTYVTNLANAGKFNQ